MNKLAFFFLLLLVACNPLSVDEGRYGNKDDAIGEPRFNIEDITELSPSEIRQDKKGENCRDYTNHTSVNFFIKNAILNPLINCIAYRIDKGFKPLCDAEIVVKEALDKERDRDSIEELEEYLENIEEEKENTINNAYEIADSVYEACQEVSESTDDITDGIGGDLSRAIGVFFDVTVKSECARVYQVIESKSRTACSGVNIEQLLKRHNRK